MMDTSKAPAPLDRTEEHTMQLHITTTKIPAVPTCTRCDNDITRGESVRIQVKKAGKCWPTRDWLCTGCAATEGFIK